MTEQETAAQIGDASPISDPVGEDQQDNAAAAAHDAPQAGNGADPLAEVRREASGYRRKLRDAEKERDQLAERLTAARMREIERAASDPAEGFRPLTDPADLWRTSTTVAELLDDDGDVDPVKVREAVEKVAEEHPHWLVPTTPRWGTADAGVGRGATSPAGDPFARALKGGG